MISHQSLMDRYEDICLQRAGNFKDLKFCPSTLSFPTSVEMIEVSNETFFRTHSKDREKVRNMVYFVLSSIDF